MNTFFDPVNNTAAVEQLNKELGKDGGRTVLISGCIDTQKAVSYTHLDVYKRQSLHSIVPFVLIPISE